MGRLIAIGDIHGRFSKLEGSIEGVIPEKSDSLVFLGDYIDRGPKSYHVVDYVVKMREEYPHIITLRGNHEDFVLSLFQGNQDKCMRHLWLKLNGGEQTLASYRGAGHYLKVHQDFYMNLPVSWETEQYFFCHAGVRPGVPLAKQKATDLLEIRDPFLSSNARFEKIIIHGHTPVSSPTITPYRINIDTGTWNNGPLTAIKLPSLRIWQQW
jgi:serine/threonine protein phosphatase 1